ncbi:MAG: UpxY family transcription antiterminator [Planctomycetes bacterium]|nr:UpxY family transcription antiterminator [Planctomycetota bacterium]
MPTLPPMPDRNPADVLDLPNDYWFVARTKPRQEKKFARWLLGRGVPFFLPMRTRQRSWRNRRITSQEPLLAGYVFFIANIEMAHKVYDSGSVAGRMDVNDQDGLVAELKRIDQLLRTGRGLSEVMGLIAGREVEITAGPCAGLRGVIAQSDKGTQLVVKLDLLGRSLQVPLEPSEVEAI